MVLADGVATLDQVIDGLAKRNARREVSNSTRFAYLLPNSHLITFHRLNVVRVYTRL